MAARSILLIALAAFLITGLIRADDVPKLTGSTIKTDDAVSKSDAIFCGTILRVALPDFDSEGYSTVGAKVKVSRILKGKVDSVVNVGLGIRYLLGITEQLPEVNHDYLFFAEIHKDDGRIEVMKPLPATDANIATVKKLISN